METRTSGIRGLAASFASRNTTSLRRDTRVSRAQSLAFCFVSENKKVVRGTVSARVSAGPSLSSQITRELSPGLPSDSPHIRTRRPSADAVGSTASTAVPAKYRVRSLGAVQPYRERRAETAGRLLLRCARRPKWGYTKCVAGIEDDNRRWLICRSPDEDYLRMGLRTAPDMPQIKTGGAEQRDSHFVR